MHGQPTHYFMIILSCEHPYYTTSTLLLQKKKTRNDSWASATISIEEILCIFLAALQLQAAREAL